MSIAVDARMLHASGIGTYLRETLPRLVALRPADRFCFLGDEEALRATAWAHFPNAAIQPATAPIYSVREQAELFRRTPVETELFWSPHYNIPLLHRGRLLVTVHDVLHLARPEFVPGAHRRLYARAMFRAVRARADAVICVSQFTADELVRCTGISRRKITVVRNGVDAFWAEPPERSPTERPYLLFVGNIKPHKNLRGLLEAFAQLRDEFPHDLVILGKREGFLTGDASAQARANELGARVRFTGYVSDAEVRAHYAHADALLFPSFYEGCGLPPLEAMAAGCPVIVSRAASLPETCGDAALYCDPYQPRDIAGKVRLLLTSSSLREELRGAGRARAAQFQWDASAAETSAVLTAVLAG